MILVKWLAMLIVATMSLFSVAYMEEASVENAAITDAVIGEETQEDGAEPNADYSEAILADADTESITDQSTDESVGDVFGDVDEIVAEEEAVDLISDDSESTDELAEEEYSLDCMEAQSTQEDACESLLAASGIKIDSTSFPDEGFRQYINEFIDINPKDGYLSDSEISNAEKIDLTGSGFGPKGSRGYDIDSLKGIEIFYNLDYLNCYWCCLTSLDVSSNTKLVYLDCALNNLTSLNVGKNPQLLVLNCWGNRISNLDISGLEKILPYVNNTHRNIRYYKSDSYYEYAGEGNLVYHGVLVSDQPSPCLSCDINTVLNAEKPAYETPATTPSVISISVPKSTKHTVKVGTTYQIDLNGKTGTKFRSSRKKVATVSSTGVIKPKSAGKTRITFKVGRKRRTLTLTVKDPTIPTSVSLNMSGTNTVNQGDTVTLTATLPTGTNSGIKWKSNHKSIATVSNGVVRFKKKGRVTITATTTRGKKKARVIFNVTKYDSKKDLSNYGWRTVTGVSGDNKLTFRRTHSGGYMHDHRFGNGEQIFVNLTWRESGDAIAYDNGTYGYVQAKYIEW